MTVVPIWVTYLALFMIVLVIGAGSPLLFYISMPLIFIMIQTNTYKLVLTESDGNE